MSFSVRALMPMIIIFIFILLSACIFRDFLGKFHIDGNVLIAANILLFIIGLVSFSIQFKGMHHKNPHVFIRSVTGGMLIKMLFCVIAVIAYVYISGESFNKRAIFISLFLYLVYLAAEVMILMKMNRSSNA